MTQRNRILGSIAWLFAVHLLAGCGSDKSGDSSGSGGAGINLGFGGASLAGAHSGSSGNGNSSGGTFDGGSVPLTDDQVTAIRSQACASWNAEIESVPSVMQLVIDVSLSMKDPAPGNNNLTKWDVTRGALLDAVVGTSGKGLPSSMAVGGLLYPNKNAQRNSSPQDADACVNTSAAVPIDLLGMHLDSKGNGTGQRRLLADSINGAVLQAYTPTFDAYHYALENLLLPTKFPGAKFMLLITDGTPTLAEGCVGSTGGNNNLDVDPTPIVNDIERASKLGVRTFVIGSPGSEHSSPGGADCRPWLSEAAVMGGTATPGCSNNGPVYCHLDMTTSSNFSAALSDGLAKIAGVVAPCTFDFPPAPSGQTIDANHINVIATTSVGASSLVLRDDIGDCAEGWQLTSDNKIRLCSQTCDAIQNDPGMTVDVRFGCTTTDEPPH